MAVSKRKHSNDARTFTVRWEGRRNQFVARDHEGRVLAAAPGRRGVIERALLDANLASCFGVHVTVLVADQAGHMRPAFVAKPLLRAG